ncbi:hypothetical protein MJO28_002006, partial [Puccinia striiformis f. sp. tritici]
LKKTTFTINSQYWSLIWPILTKKLSLSPPLYPQRTRANHVKFLKHQNMKIKNVCITDPPAVQSTSVKTQPKRPRPKKLGTVRLKSQETKSISAKVLPEPKETQTDSSNVLPERSESETISSLEHKTSEPISEKGKIIIRFKVKASSTQPDQALDPIPSCVKPAPPKSAPNERSVAIGTHKPEQALFKDVHDWKEALLIWADIVKLNVPANQPRSRNQEPRPQHSSTRPAPSGSAPSGTAPSGTDSSRRGPPPPYNSDSTPARPYNTSSQSQTEPGPARPRPSPRPASPRPSPCPASPRSVSPRSASPRPAIPSPCPASPRPASLRPASPRPASPCPASPCPASPQLAPDREECEAEFVAGQIPDNTAERREVIPYGTA